MFSLYLLSGIVVYKDYGMSLDEPFERWTSLINYVYVMGENMRASDSAAVQNIANSVPDLMTWRDRYYGTALQNITIMIEHLLGFKVSWRDAILLRHIFTFINYFIAGFCFYLILKRRFGDTYVPLLGALLYILYPRFFGESFYNIKDILFYSWIIIAVCFVLQWLENGKVRFLLPASAALAVAMNTRILGLSLLLLACAFAIILEIRPKPDYKNLYPRTETFSAPARSFCRNVASVLTLRTTASKRRPILPCLTAKILAHVRKMFPFAGIIKKPLSLFALTSVFYIVITPFLWENPLKNTVAVFSHFLQYQLWHGEHLYLGKMISSEVPWHYIPVWMGVTIPLLYLVMFLIGSVAISIEAVTWIKSSIRCRQRETKNLCPHAVNGNISSLLPKNLHLYDLFFAALFFCTLLGYIILNISMYEGWRHAYGIFFPFLYIAVFGIARVYAFTHGKPVIFLRGLVCAVVISLSYQLVWIVVNHPYQYVYFNVLGKQVAEKNFTLDYWDVSHYDLIRYALAHDNNPQITINSVYGSGFQSFFLTGAENARVIWADIADAEYYIQHTRMAYNDRTPPPGFKELKEITVDGMKISILYARSKEHY